LHIIADFAISTSRVDSPTGGHPARRNGQQLLGHNGYDDGYRSEMFFRPSDGDGAGAIVLTNGDYQTTDDPAIAIQTRLMQEAAAF
jgi:hypothetical protein